VSAEIPAQIVSPEEAPTQKYDEFIPATPACKAFISITWM